jgi:hypothetical protein
MTVSSHSPLVVSHWLFRSHISPALGPTRPTDSALPEKALTHPQRLSPAQIKSPVISRLQKHYPSTKTDSG